MKAVIQRVNSCSLSVDNCLISEISKGLTVYLGVIAGDSYKNLEYLAKKISHMRIFADEDNKMNKSILDIGGEIMLVSQFTLSANCARGNRPDFAMAEEWEKAKDMYLTMEKLLIQHGVPVKMGIFGADMQITQVNDGPVTIVLDTDSL